jgi:hypothetical protein
MSKGRVTAPGLNMHLAPGSEKIVHTLAKGDVVAIIKTEQHTKLWHFVWFRKDDFAKYGWVIAEAVEVLAPPAREVLEECEEVAPPSLWIAGLVAAIAIVLIAGLAIFR